MTKSILKYLVLLVLLALLNDCTKNKCSDNCILDRIEFFNLYPDKLNTLQIRGYSKGSNFSMLIDSTYKIIDWIEHEANYWYFTGSLNKDLMTDLDYEFLFPDYREKCRITDIKVNLEPCSFGLFSKAYSRSFDGYYVNDERFACQIIKVFPVEY